MKHFVVLTKSQFPPIHIQADDYYVTEYTIGFNVGDIGGSEGKVVATFDRQHTIGVCEHDYLMGQTEEAAERATEALVNQ